MKNILYFILFTSLQINAQAVNKQKYLSVEEIAGGFKIISTQTGMGLLDKNNRQILAPIYYSINPHHYDLFELRIKNKYGWANSKGILLDAKYECIGSRLCLNLEDVIAKPENINQKTLHLLVMNQKKWQLFKYVRESGTIKIQPFTNLGTSSTPQIDTLRNCQCRRKDGSSDPQYTVMVDNNGNEIIGDEYEIRDDAEFKNGEMWAQVNGKSVVINQKGKVIEPQYDTKDSQTITDSDGEKKNFYVTTKNSKKGLLNNEGEKILETIFDDIQLLPFPIRAVTQKEGQTSTVYIEGKPEFDKYLLEKKEFESNIEPTVSKKKLTRDYVMVEGEKLYGPVKKVIIKSLRTDNKGVTSELTSNRKEFIVENGKLIESLYYDNFVEGNQLKIKSFYSDDNIEPDSTICMNCPITYTNYPKIINKIDASGRIRRSETILNKVSSSITVYNHNDDGLLNNTFMKSFNALKTNSDIFPTYKYENIYENGELKQQIQYKNNIQYNIVNYSKKQNTTNNYTFEYDKYKNWIQRSITGSSFSYERIIIYKE